MLKEVKLLVAFASLAFCNGCGEDSSPGDDASSRFCSEVSAIKDSLGKDEARYPYDETVARMTALIGSISNRAYRADAAFSYAKMLEEISLTSLPYHTRETSVIMFGGHTFFAFQLMVKNGVAVHEAMASFFKCMGKYRDACASASESAKGCTESRTDYKNRKECARILRDNYRYRMSIIQRCWLPRLSNYLPTQYHEEFKRRIEPFMRALPVADGVNLNGGDRAGDV